MQLHEASWLRVDPRPGETRRAALERVLREAILEGALRAGARLPSSRRLAAQLGVSRGVTSDAYGQLEAQGFLVIRPRSAPVVAAVPRRRVWRARREEPAPRAVRFDMSPTTPDVALFPSRRWLAAVAHAARRAPLDALDYGDPRGEPALRETLAEHIGRTRGVIADPAHVLVVQGTAQAIDLLLRLLIARGARTVAIEDPSLNRQRERIEALGLDPVGRPVDEEGIVVDGMEADAAIVTPAHQFPTGAVLSGERRRALLAWAREQRALVIEDDYDAEFRYDRDPVRALQGLDPARVAYLGSVSKSLAPALRLGWLVVPPALAANATRTKLLLDAGSPVLDQLALNRLLRSGDYDRHIRRARAVYRSRRDRLRAALADHLPELPVEGIAAGMHVLVRLPEGLDDARLANEAERDGVRVQPLSAHAHSKLKAGGFVLGYGRIHEEALGPAVEALARAIRRAGG